MILVIGAAYAGKSAYVNSILPEVALTDGETCAEDAVFHCAGIDHFHAYIRRQMEAGKEISDLPDKILRKNPEVVIISDEIGYGIVPETEFLRAYRETTGRILTDLAARADKVYRVVCGIGTVIK